jgi:hypothetical protein
MNGEPARWSPHAAQPSRAAGPANGVVGAVARGRQADDVVRLSQQPLGLGHVAAQRAALGVPDEGHLGGAGLDQDPAREGGDGVGGPRHGRRSVVAVVEAEDAEAVGLEQRA